MACLRCGCMRCSETCGCPGSLICNEHSNLVCVQMLPANTMKQKRENGKIETFRNLWIPTTSSYEMPWLDPPTAPPSFNSNFLLDALLHIHILWMLRAIVLFAYTTAYHWFKIEMDVLSCDISLPPSLRWRPFDTIFSKYHSCTRMESLSFFFLFIILNRECCLCSFYS